MAIKSNCDAGKVPFLKFNIKPLFQNDPSLRKEINDFGCRFMCMLTIPQIVNGKVLTTQQIEYIYQQAISGNLGEDVMDSNCTCGTNEHKMINEAFTLLGDDDRYCRQWYTSDNADNHRDISSLPSDTNVLFTVVDFRTIGNTAYYGGHHFVLFNAIGDFIYDPMNNKVGKYRDMYRWLVYKVYSAKQIAAES